MTTSTTEINEPNGGDATIPKVEEKPKDVWEAGLHILKTADAFEKARLTLEAVKDYRQGHLALPPSLPLEKEDIQMLIPSIPARPVLHPRSDIKAKGVIPTIHGIAHAESWAIDLMWDLMIRFAYEPFPAEFWSEFIEIAGQEAEHFLSWTRILEDSYGLRYGDLKGHETLWESAEATAEDVMARLAVINLVHEARGLDTSDLSLKKFERAGDQESMSTLLHNAIEEEGHVAAGIRWFCYIKEKRGLPGSCAEVFHSYGRKYHQGAIRPPFNEEARRRAGMTPEWYEPLVTTTDGGGRKEKE